MASFPIMSNPAHAKNIRVSMEQRKKLIDGGNVISGARLTANKGKDDQRPSGWGTKQYQCGMDRPTIMETMNKLIHSTGVRF